MKRTTVKTRMLIMGMLLFQAASHRREGRYRKRELYRKLPYIQMEQAGPDKASNILLRLLNIAIFSSHILQYISACYA